MENDNNIDEVFLSEYLITIKNNMPTYNFTTLINNELDSQGFRIKNKYLFAKKRDKEIKIFKIEINKIYPQNIKRKDIYFLIKIFDLKERENLLNNEKIWEKSPPNSDLKRFRDMLEEKIKSIKEVEEIYLIKDDYIAFLLENSYPLIFKIENLMRELILKIMSFMGKKNWIESEVPNEIFTQIKDDKRKKLGVYGTDFSHLTDLLFKPTEKSNINNLLSMLNNLDNCNKKQILKIKSMIPKSNWEKYFSEIHIKESLNQIKEYIYKEDLEDIEVLKKILQDLKEMRNIVAHNNIYIKYDFYEGLERKSKYFIKWIEDSINYIENLKKDETIERTKKDFSN